MHARDAVIMHAGHAIALESWGGDASSVVTLAALTAAYALGARRIWGQAGNGRGVRPRQVTCFVLALVVLSLAMLTPIDALSGVLFSAHMTQHVLLAVVAPPLLVLSMPGVALLWAAPRRARRRIADGMRVPAVAALWRRLTEPFTACAVHAVALWMWHAPRLYVAALDSALVHFLEHASFVATGALLWWAILHPHQPRRAGYGTGIAVLFLTTLQSGALGALLTFSTTVWFPAQHSGTALIHLTALQDQQLAGLIMWVPGGLLYTAAMGLLFAAWMRQLDRATPSAPAVAGSALSA